MNRIRVITLAATALLCLASCTGKAQNSRSNEASESTAQSARPTEFPYPDIPVTLTEPEARKDFLLRHYWDKFNFADTVLVNDRDITEQALVNQLALLADTTTTATLTEASIDHLCSGMEREAYARAVFMQLMDDYLFDPNSPLYSESLYAVYLRRMMQSTALDDVRKSSLSYRLKLISLNRPGTPASDFTYYLPDGSRHTLRDTPVKGNRLLLVFYDPECESCQQTLRQMTSDIRLLQALQQGKLTVLAVYTEANPEAWKREQPYIPSSWLNATDREAIKSGPLYDLKAMPALYLLDGQKKVLLKDAKYEEVITAVSGKW